jgi:hypothetical protein
MTARNYKIRITRDGQEFEAEGDKAFVLKMLARFEAAGSAEPFVPEVRTKKKGSQGREGTKSLAPKSKALSIREFVQRLGFKKHTEITLAFGYYLEHQAEAFEFTPADINNCYYEAKIEASNTSQMIIQNIRRGFMMQAKSKGDKGRKRYTLTNSGEKFIETRLSNTA